MSTGTAVTTDTTVETRTAMSWDDYEALDQDVRGEYFGGMFVMYSAPSRRHQRIAYELTKALEAGLPEGAAVTMAWGWSPVGLREELVPDVMVHRSHEDKRLTEPPPMLVVEVLSSNRLTDIVEKSVRYARWGAPSYWTVDPRDRILLAHDRIEESIYVNTFAGDRGVATIGYGAPDDRGEALVDLDALFRDG